MVEAINSAQSIAQTIQAGEGQRPSLPPYSETARDKGTAKVGGQPLEQDQLILGQNASAMNLAEAQKEQGRAASASQDQQKEQLKELEEILENLNKKMNLMNREVHFLVDKKINKQYISVIDRETKNVIREFPPQEIRSFIAALQNFMENLDKGKESASLLVDRQV